MKKRLSLMLLSFFLLIPQGVFAAKVDNMKDVPDWNDFDLGATSFSIELAPGQSITKTLQVTNRTGEKTDFFVDVEDFEGSADPGQPVVLQGKETGRYSAKDWIKPELSQFTLEHGQRQFFDVTITVPKDSVDAGDHYASVLVKTLPKSVPTGDSKNIQLTSRVGSLFFIRVPGDAVEKGFLKSFETDSISTKKEPIEFRMLFENTGAVRLNPSGLIVVTDMFGRLMENIEVSPFNVLRNSTRLHSEQWMPGLLPGRYTVTAQIQRGYDDKVDVDTIHFWYFPIKEIAIAIGVLLAATLLIWWLRKYVHLQIGLK